MQEEKSSASMYRCDFSSEYIALGTSVANIFLREKGTLSKLFLFY